MAQVWKCDRCKRTQDNGLTEDLPDGWIRRSMPVRGSEGARSETTADICTVCDDSLYKWFQMDEATPRS